MNYTPGRNLYIKATAVPKYITAAGDLANPDQNNLTSDFIDVIPGQSYTFGMYTEDTSYQPWPWSRCAWYDANKKFLSVFGYSVTNYAYVQTVTAPDGATYARLSARHLSNDISRMKFEYGDTATPWRPAPEDLAGPSDYVLNSGAITLSCVVDVASTTRYYLLRASTQAAPAKPTANPPTGGWDDAEPGYVSGSTNTLYFTDLTVFSDGSWSYSAVSASSAYEAAKAAYNKAQAAQSAVEALDDALTQQEIFNRLTDNGAAQGMVLYNGQLYINANYINAGIIRNSENDNNYWNLLTGEFSATQGSLGEFTIDNHGLSKSNTGTIYDYDLSINPNNIKYQNTLKASNLISQTLLGYASISLSKRYEDDYNWANCRITGGQDTDTGAAVLTLYADGQLAGRAASVQLTSKDHADGGTLTVNANLKVTGETNLDNPLPIDSGGTGATGAAQARTNLGITPANIGAKATQGAVSDPTASGTAVSFIDSISQNAQGVITPTKKTVAGATQSAAGLMSAEDKKKLDGIAGGAQVNTLTGVKGNAESSYRTGNVNITPANVGALAKSGDTATGQILVPSSSGVYHDGGAPMHYFLYGRGNATANKMGAIYAAPVSVNGKYGMSRFVFRQYTYNSTTGEISEYWDQYRLPANTPNRTNSETFDILTSKNLTTMTITLASQTWNTSSKGMFYTNNISVSGASKIIAITVSDFTALRTTDNVVPYIYTDTAFRLMSNTKTFADTSNSKLTVKILYV